MAAIASGSHSIVELNASAIGFANMKNKAPERRPAISPTSIAHFEDMLSASSFSSPAYRLPIIIEALIKPDVMKSTSPHEAKRTDIAVEPFSPPNT